MRAVACGADDRALAGCPADDALQRPVADRSHDVARAAARRRMVHRCGGPDVSPRRIRAAARIAKRLRYTSVEDVRTAVVMREKGGTPPPQTPGSSPPAPKPPPPASAPPLRTPPSPPHQIEPPAPP